MILVVALIVIPPENLPDVMRATGKVLRELRLASNMVLRELGGALDQAPEHRTEPSLNTMKSSTIATGANIAQSAASADPKVSADSAVAPDQSTVVSDDSAAEAAGSADAPAKHLTQS